MNEWMMYMHVHWVSCRAERGLGIYLGK